MSRNFLSMNSELEKGDFLIFNNGDYKAMFQDDGNFVVYTWRPVWASNTCGVTEAQRLLMQSDCNLVMYTKNNEAVWATNTDTANAKVSRLTLGDDGYLRVENDGSVLWTSNNWKEQQ